MFVVILQGFFTDLALVSAARTGFIGQLERSSSHLLLDLIEYDRKREELDKNGFAVATKLPALKMCTYWRPR
jgi:hypothetical protein